jgi:hypothetical protein
VVLARFALPLLIPLFPLPAILACLLLDGVDQTIFQTFGFNPPFYQSYDKAMDVFYLSIAYLASLRNWTKPEAVRVSRFLFFYRQIGVVAFELTGLRWLLLVFPNTFEYYFIAYETVRTRPNPDVPGCVAPRSRCGRSWLAQHIPGPGCPAAADRPALPGPKSSAIAGRPCATWWPRT